jgi:hypothetical protein
MSGDAQPSIDELLQLPLPAPVSYWPQTWGWLALAAAVLIVIGVAAWRHVRHRRRNRYRREGLRLLQDLQRAARADPRAARALPPLLKRVGLSSVSPADRAGVAVLAGEDWVAFLKSGADVFPADVGPLLRKLAYGPDVEVQAIPAAKMAQLFTASRLWMERHHVAA